MTADTQHLGVLGIACDEHRGTCGGVLGHDFVNLRHEGAGGVATPHAQILHLTIGALGHAVGADDQHAAGGHLGRVVHDGDATGGQIVHHLRVVDDGAEGAYPLALVQQAAHLIDRIIDAEAESGAFGKTDRHRKNSLLR